MRIGYNCSKRVRTSSRCELQATSTEIKISILTEQVTVLVTIYLYIYITKMPNGEMLFQLLPIESLSKLDTVTLIIDRSVVTTVFYAYSQDSLHDISIREMVMGQGSWYPKRS